MSHAIKGFQHDKALELADRIAHETGSSVDTARIESVLQKHGVVGYLTSWQKMDAVLNDLGYDYDEIFEVLSR